MKGYSPKRQFVFWAGVCLATTALLVPGCHSAKKSDPPMDPKGSTAGADPSMSQAGAKKGQELFDTVGCMGCHMVHGKGGAVGPNLSDEADRGRSRQWLTTQIRNPKENDPGSIMPAFNNLSKENVSDLVDYLMTLSEKKSSQDKKTGEIGKTAMSGSGAVGSGKASVTWGGETWSDACGRCHNLRAPSEFSDAQWTVVLDHMRLIVPLTGQEQRDVLEFLKASN